MHEFDVPLSLIIEGNFRFACIGIFENFATDVAFLYLSLTRGGELTYALSARFMRESREALDVL